ncbi:peptidase M20 [candidate division LCP-89 bacterium B3_LCP]|uniref:Peptidase M20 n=1 Tax=candidate division LCP-89 bacterium B3_LCP TaxID=2012998 RepID=A0A532UZD4_UNCL8|nr:MAG: peptidase M20 [candidate division LCP-89 bacterium B3_LCP]
MINSQRLKRFFFELVQIDSHSRDEKKVAEYLQDKLERLGAVITMDDTAEKIGGNCGNLLARISGPLEGKVEPLLFCSHMDTVVPGEGVKPVEDDGVIRSSGDTILGSDDKSGIAAILEMLHVLKENDLPFGALEILFTVAEEVGLLGARNFDTSVLKSKRGYFLDSEYVSKISVGAPAAYRMRYEIFGHEAHAGLAPEQGISAIQVAAKAINNMPMGRIDSETTANIGVIEGGTATNIVTKQVILRGEARSHNDKKLEEQVAAMRKAIQDAVDSSWIELDGKRIQAHFEEATKREYISFRIPESSLSYQLPQKAGKAIGLEMEPEISGGGSDANIFNEKGIESLIIGTGMQAVHTVKEHISFKDMENCANLLINMIQLHGKA